MATFPATGQSQHELSDGTTLLFVTMTTPGFDTRYGRAYPPNAYDLALLRFGVDDYVFAAFVVDSSQFVVPVPVGANRVYWSCIAGAELSLQENNPPVIGGAATLSTDVIDFAAHVGDTVTLTWANVDAPLPDDQLCLISSGQFMQDGTSWFGPVGFPYAANCDDTTVPSAGAASGTCSQVLTANTLTNPNNVTAYYIRFDGTILVQAPDSFGIYP